MGPAGWPGDRAIWHQPSFVWLGFSPGVGCELLSIFHMIPRPVGLALTHLGPPLLCHVDPGSCVAPQVGLGLG